MTYLTAFTWALFFLFAAFLFVWWIADSKRDVPSPSPEKHWLEDLPLTIHISGGVHDVEQDGWL